MYSRFGIEEPNGFLLLLTIDCPCVTKHIWFSEFSSCFTPHHSCYVRCSWTSRRISNKWNK